MKVEMEINHVREKFWKLREKGKVMVWRARIVGVVDEWEEGRNQRRSILDVEVI